MTIRALRKLRTIFRKPVPVVGADDRDGNYVSKRPHIIIGGCGRSGTTLVRLLLDGHPHICCGPESKLYLPECIKVAELAHTYKLNQSVLEQAYADSHSRTDFIDSFAEICCESAGKRRWAEKTPRNILNLDYVFRAFPECRFIHVLRDGRDVACSLRTHPRHRVENGVLVALNTWNPMDQCARRWRDDIIASKPYWCDRRFYLLRYEQLVADPRSTMENLLDFLGEPWDNAVLANDQVQSSFRDPLMFPQSREAVGPITSDTKGRWERDLAVDDKKCFKRIAGDLLVELGYATDNDW